MVQAITDSLRCAAVKLGGIEGASYAPASFVQNVRVDHRCFDAGMPQQFLDGADVVEALRVQG